MAEVGVQHGAAEVENGFEPRRRRGRRGGLRRWRAGRRSWAPAGEADRLAGVGQGFAGAPGDLGAPVAVGRGSGRRRAGGRRLGRARVGGACGAGELLSDVVPWTMDAIVGISWFFVVGVGAGARLTGGTGRGCGRRGGSRPRRRACRGRGWRGRRRRRRRRGRFHRDDLEAGLAVGAGFGL